MTMTNEQAMAALEYFAGETCSSFCVTWEHRHAPCDCGRAKKLLILRAFIEASAEAEEALDRITHSYRALLSRKPVRDATETLAEADAALARLRENEDG